MSSNSLLDPPILTLPRLHHAAPKFDGQPSSLIRYLHEVHFAGKLHGFSDRDMIEQAIFYAPDNDYELWNMLPEATGHDWDMFKSSVVRLYPGADDDRKYSFHDLEVLVENSSMQPIYDYNQFGTYYRAFLRLSSFLKRRSRLTDHEAATMFLLGLHVQFRRKVRDHLRLLYPDHHPDDPWTLEQVSDAAIFLVSPTSVKKRTEPAPMEIEDSLLPASVDLDESNTMKSCLATLDNIESDLSPIYMLPLGTPPSNMLSLSTTSEPMNSLVLSPPLAKQNGEPQAEEVLSATRTPNANATHHEPNSHISCVDYPSAMLSPSKECLSIDGTCAGQSSSDQLMRRPLANIDVKSQGEIGHEDILRIASHVHNALKITFGIIGLIPKPHVRPSDEGHSTPRPLQDVVKHSAHSVPRPSLTKHGTSSHPLCSAHPYLNAIKTATLRCSSVIYYSYLDLLYVIISFDACLTDLDSRSNYGQGFPFDDDSPGYIPTARALPVSFASANTWATFPLNLYAFISSAPYRLGSQSSKISGRTGVVTPLMDQIFAFTKTVLRFARVMPPSSASLIRRCKRVSF